MDSNREMEEFTPEPIERMDYYNIPSRFQRSYNIERMLIFTRYELASKYIKDGKTLEIGCGTGAGARLLSELQCKHSEYVGIDLSAGAIQSAQSEYAPFGSFRNANAEDLHIFDDNSFKNIICFENIEHLKNPRNSLLEMYRILRADGMLLLSTPNRMNWGIADDNPYHLRHYTYEQLVAEAEECGFNLIKTHGIFFYPNNFKLASILNRMGINLSERIENSRWLLNLFFKTALRFPRKSRLLFFVFKKRSGFNYNKMF